MTTTTNTRPFSMRALVASLAAAGAGAGVTGPAAYRAGHDAGEQAMVDAPADSLQRIVDAHGNSAEAMHAIGLAMARSAGKPAAAGQPSYRELERRMAAAERTAARLRGMVELHGAGLRRWAQLHPAEWEAWMAEQEPPAVDEPDDRDGRP